MKIAIVYHSGYGHTKKLAEAVLTGVKQSSAETFFINVNEVNESTWLTLASADGIIFGCPTYMGGVSADFKKFADASSKAWFKLEWKDKIAAGFTNSASMNGDKLSSLQYMWTLSQQHGMIWVGTGLMASSTKAAQRNDINYLGGFSGLLGQSPSDASPEEGPLPGDLETAKLFGARVAKVTKKFINGKD